ncbi:uncharacterized protein FIBRA_07455 [Fibroporia radiculosa]|uniref:Cytochrome P450 n=1 Tax=Fibroporia radiculosa TaxID=599839 RepID=J4GV08_9APHY|nr:uncharacterized protein FIBRA_07455 [Fibroporia radiculosa]CCM05245.1 predicted protein [Fibroporia radiculosa]
MPTITEMSVEGMVAPAALGFLSYLVFKKLEPTDMVSLVALLGIIPAIPVSILYPPLDSMLLAVVVSYAIYYGVLTASIVTYRLSPMHPLAKYPGPLACKVSKLWLVYVASGGRQYSYFYKVHKKYGPIVRIGAPNSVLFELTFEANNSGWHPGPNELSIVDATLLPSILGANGMPKGPMWEGRRFTKEKGAGEKTIKGNLINTRNTQHHAEERQVWNRAFSTASVKKYEPIVIRRAAQLVEALKTKCGEAETKGAQVNMSDWLSFFSFDFMGDFVFSGPFDLLRDGDANGLVRLMELGLYPPALTQHIPWCIQAVLRLPFFGKQAKKLGEFTYRQVKKRMSDGSFHDDLFYYLSDESRQKSEPVPMGALLSNSILAIVAGSDTTAAALSNTLYLLVSHPECYERLQSELDNLFPLGKGEPTDTAKLAQMEFLNAVINESLRIQPPVRTSLQRAPEAGSGGHMIGSDMFISEGTAVYVPPYVYHRDPRYFSPDPDRFWPERWLSRGETGVVLDTNAFIPFSTGPANCVGRSLALVELRMVLAYLLQAFEFRFAEGYDRRVYEDSLQDFLVTHRGPLPLVLTPRVAH